MNSTTTQPTTAIDISLVQLALGYAADQIRARESKRKALAMIGPDNHELRWTVLDAISAATDRRNFREFRYAVGIQA